MITTSIAESLETAGLGALCDAAAKRLVSHKSVVAWILKAVCREFSGYGVKYIAERCVKNVKISDWPVHQDHVGRTERLDGDDRVEMMNSESSSINEGNIYFDLRLRARVPGCSGDVYLMVNLEIQNDDNPHYPLTARGLYYAARMISEQFGTVFKGMDYQDIQKVYSIWICPRPSKGRGDSILKFRINQEVVQGKSFYEEKDYDKMEMVLIEAGDGVDYNGKSITGLLSVLFSSTMGLEEKKDVLSRVYGIEMTKEFEREVKDMCNISRAYYEEGLNKGRMEGSLLILNQLVDKGKLSICDAAAMANMTVEGFLKKKEELKKETQ